MTCPFQQKRLDACMRPNLHRVAPRDRRADIGCWDRAAEIESLHFTTARNADSIELFLSFDAFRHRGQIKLSRQANHGVDNGKTVPAPLDVQIDAMVVSRKLVEVTGNVG